MGSTTFNNHEIHNDVQSWSATESELNTSEPVSPEDRLVRRTGCAAVRTTVPAAQGIDDSILGSSDRITRLGDDALAVLLGGGVIARGDRISCLLGLGFGLGGLHRRRHSASQYRPKGGVRLCAGLTGQTSALPCRRGSAANRA